MFKCKFFYKLWYIMQHVFSNSSVSPQNSRCQIWEFVFKNIIILSRNFVLFKNVAGFTRNNVAVLISSRIVHAIHPFYLTRCFFYTNTFYLIHIIICHKQFVLKENHISLSFFRSRNHSCTFLLFLWKAGSTEWTHNRFVFFCPILCGV